MNVKTFSVLVACVLPGIVTAGREYEQINADQRPRITLSLDGEETLALACGLTVPRIKYSRGFPGVTVGIMRSNPSDEDLSSAYQLWKVDQFVATWRDPATNVVSLLQMAYPFPRRYRPEQRLPANQYYLDTRTEAAEGYSSISQDNIHDWLYTYYQGRYSTDFKPIWTGPGLKTCTKYTAYIGGLAHLIYVFNVKNEKGVIAGQTPYFILDITTGKPSISTALDQFAEQFLKKITFDPVAYLTARDFWNTEPFESFMSANAVRSIINLADEWKDFHYDHFILLANNPVCFDFASEGLIHLENVYRLFPSVLPACNPESEQSVAVLRVFATAWEYEDCLPRSRKWSGGVYAGNDEILLRGWSAEVTVHEAAHQYMHLATGRRGVSTWFNEGFACYFGGCKVVDGQLVAEPIDSGHLLISMVKKKEMSIIEDVFTVRDFYQDEELERNPRSPSAALKRAKNYAATWGVIYFLREAPPSYPGKDYDLLIPLYWETLQKTGDADSATRAVLRKLTMTTFLDDFREYFLSLEEVYKEKERKRGDPKCGCEYCEMLRRTRQPYPPELSLCADDHSPASKADAPILNAPAIPPTKEEPPRATNPSLPRVNLKPSAAPEPPKQPSRGESWGLLFAVSVWVALVLFVVRAYTRRKKG